MEKQENEKQYTMNDLYEYTAHLILNEGVSYETASSNLMSMGLDEASATSVVSKTREAIQSHRDAQQKEDNGTQVLVGILWLVGGIIASAASERFIFIGAIAYGLIKIISGLSKK